MVQGRIRPEFAAKVAFLRAKRNPPGLSRRVFQKRHAQGPVLHDGYSRNALFPVSVIPNLQRTGLSTYPSFFKWVISLLTSFASLPVGPAMSFVEHGPSIFSMVSRTFFSSSVNVFELHAHPHPIVSSPLSAHFFFCSLRICPQIPTCNQ
jgi:hypothetical protein